jgi:hypothetical protein
VRSRGTDVGCGAMSDLIEAGLNKPAGWRTGYGYFGGASCTRTTIGPFRAAMGMLRVEPLMPKSAVMTIAVERKAALAAGEPSYVSRIKRFGKAISDGADCVDAGR